MTDATEWQPIDTVPTDGRRVWLWDERRQYVTLASWVMTQVDKDAFTHWRKYGMDVEGWDLPTFRLVIDAAPQRDLT